MGDQILSRFDRPEKFESIIWYGGRACTRTLYASCLPRGGSTAGLQSKPPSSSTAETTTLSRPYPDPRPSATCWRRRERRRKKKGIRKTQRGSCTNRKAVHACTIYTYPVLCTRVLTLGYTSLSCNRTRRPTMTQPTSEDRTAQLFVVVVFFGAQRKCADTGKELQPTFFFAISITTHAPPKKIPVDG